MYIFHDDTHMYLLIIARYGCNATYIVIISSEKKRIGKYPTFREKILVDGTSLHAQLQVIIMRTTLSRLTRVKLGLLENHELKIMIYLYTQIQEIPV